MAALFGAVSHSVPQVGSERRVHPLVRLWSHARFGQNALPSAVMCSVTCVQPAVSISSATFFRSCVPSQSQIRLWSRGRLASPQSTLQIPRLWWYTITPSKAAKSSLPTVHPSCLWCLRSGWKRLRSGQGRGGCRTRLEPQIEARHWTHAEALQDTGHKEESKRGMLEAGSARSNCCGKLRMHDRGSQSNRAQEQS